MGRLMDAFGVDEKNSDVAEKMAKNASRNKSVAKPGRPRSLPSDDNQSTSIRISRENMIYAQLRAKELAAGGHCTNTLSGVIGYLISEDRGLHPDVSRKADRILEIERE